LSEAVYDGTAQVEDITCRKISTFDEAQSCWDEGVVPLIIDPDGISIGIIKPKSVIDAIIAKRNIGTTKCMADITIALGPGFYAGKDVHAVIETKRGHDLGKLILDGSASVDTGVPGEIAGESSGRVLYAQSEGVVAHKKQIGDIVEQGEAILAISGKEYGASISGLLRGLIREEIQVYKGMKIADIDPRIDIDWRTISDKAHCLGGAALEAYFYLANKLQGETNYE